MSEQGERKPRLGAGLWVALAGLGAVLAVWLFWPSAPPTPPPPQQLPRSVFERAAPPETPVTHAPAAELPLDMKAREEHLEARTEAATAHEPPRPTLRRSDPGIPPKKMMRQEQGATGGAAGLLKLLASYGGKRISGEVVVDGVARGKTPLSVSLPEGDHVIRIDYGPTRVNQFVTRVQRGRAVQLDVTLRSPKEIGRNPAMKGAEKYRE